MKIEAKIAKTFFSRLRGLVGCSFQKAQALFIPHCRSIHTIGMRFPLEVFFLDQHHRVLKRKKVGPMKFVFEKNASHVLEFPWGKAPKDLQEGDLVDILLDERGQSLVEFAMVLPIIVVLIYGLFHLGLAITIKNEMVFAANQGAHTGSLTNNDEKILEIINFALPTPNFQTNIVSYFSETPQQVIPSSQRTRNDYVKVILTYTYTKFSIPFLGIEKDIVLRAEATSRVVCFNPDPYVVPLNTCK